MMYYNFQQLLTKLNSQKGQTMVECGLILFFISIAAVAMLPGIGGAVLGFFTLVAALV